MDSIAHFLLSVLMLVITYIGGALGIASSPDVPPSTPVATNIQSAATPELHETQSASGKDESALCDLRSSPDSPKAYTLPAPPSDEQSESAQLQDQVKTELLTHDPNPLKQINSLSHHFNNALKKCFVRALYVDWCGPSTVRDAYECNNQTIFDAPGHDLIYCSTVTALKSSQTPTTECVDDTGPGISISQSAFDNEADHYMTQ
jgi:hypothetical protein